MIAFTQGIDLWSVLKVLAAVSSIIGVPLTIVLHRKKENEVATFEPAILDASSRYACESPGLSTLDFPDAAAKMAYLILQSCFQGTNQNTEVDFLHIWTSLISSKSNRLRAFCFILRADFQVRQKHYRLALAWLVDAETAFQREEPIITAIRNHATACLLEKTTSN